MSQTTRLLTTHVRDELESTERGVRHWSMAQIQDDRWYQVETCSHFDGVPTVTTYIVLDLKKALRLIRSLKGNTWTTLRLYTRLPLLARSGFILESVKSIFSTTDETCMIFLESGLVLTDSSTQPSVPRSFTKLEELYREG